VKWASESAKDQYLQLINRAVTTEAIFKCFKSMPVFQRVVGITDDPYALECYKEFSTNPDVMKNLSKFYLNDTVGTPFLSLARLQVKTPDGFTHSKQFGCDTLRYIHTVHLIQKNFGSMDGKTVIEWGSCYGGLAYCLLTQWPNILQYIGIDLPEVTTLAQQYLKALNVKSFEVGDLLIINNPTETFRPAATDLFISELALTEYDDETVFSEYDKYGKNAGGLLIRMNFPDDVRKANFIDYIKQDFKVTFTQEHPCRAHNYVVIGTK
jgi:hypothetical protein